MKSFLKFNLKIKLWTIFVLCCHKTHFRHEPYCLQKRTYIFTSIFLYKNKTNKNWTQREKKMFCCQVGASWFAERHLLGPLTVQSINVNFFLYFYCRQKRNRKSVHIMLTVRYVRLVRLFFYFFKFNYHECEQFLFTIVQEIMDA